jgi:hypothetical protein
MFIYIEVVNASIHTFDWYQDFRNNDVWKYDEPSGSYGLFYTTHLRLYSLISCYSDVPLLSTTTSLFIHIQ